MSASADSSAFPSLGYSYPSKLQSQMVNNWGLQTGNHIMPTPYSPSPTPSYLMGGLADPNRAVDYVTFDPATGYPLVQGDTGSLAALQHNITTYIGNVFPNTPVSVGTNIYKLITAPTGSQYYQTQSFTGTKFSTSGSVQGQWQWVGQNSDGTAYLVEFAWQDDGSQAVNLRWYGMMFWQLVSEPPPHQNGEADN